MEEQNVQVLPLDELKKWIDGNRDRIARAVYGAIPNIRTVAETMSIEGKDDEVDASMINEIAHTIGSVGPSLMEDAFKKEFSELVDGPLRNLPLTASQIVKENENEWAYLMIELYRKEKSIRGT